MPRNRSEMVNEHVTAVDLPVTCLKQLQIHKVQMKCKAPTHGINYKIFTDQIK